MRFPPVLLTVMLMTTVWRSHPGFGTTKVVTLTRTGAGIPNVHADLLPGTPVTSTVPTRYHESDRNGMPVSMYRLAAAPYGAAMSSSGPPGVVARQTR